MSEFTKGPWFIEDEACSLDANKSVSIGSSHQGDWSSFAMVAVRMDDEAENSRAGMANARLISDAPAMRLILDLVANGAAEIRTDLSGPMELVLLRPDSEGLVHYAKTFEKSYAALLNLIGWDLARKALAKAVEENAL